MPDKDTAVRWIRVGGEDGELVIRGDDDGELERHQIEFREEAVAAARESGNLDEEGAALFDLGVAYFSLGQLSKAAEHLEQALVTYRELGDRKEEANALSHLGTVYELQNQATRAIEYRKQAIDIYRELGDRHGEAKQLGSLGTLVSFGPPKQMKRGLEYLKQALSISREIGDRNHEALTLSNIGTGFMISGQMKDALRCLEQALSISREIDDRDRETRVLQNLATLHMHMGQAERARERVQQALSISREIGDRETEARQLLSLGTIYSHLDQSEKAIEATEAAVRILDETGGPGADEARKRLEHLRNPKSNKRMVSIGGALLVIVLIAAFVGARLLLASLAAKSEQTNADFWSTARALQTRADPPALGQPGYVSLEAAYRNAPIGHTTPEVWQPWQDEYAGRYARGEGTLTDLMAVREGGLFLAFSIFDEEGAVGSNTAEVALLVQDARDITLGEQEGSVQINGLKWIQLGADYSFEGRISEFSLFDTDLATAGYLDLLILKGSMFDIAEK